MAAGKSYIAITPGDRQSGIPRCKSAPEGSSQTYLKGAPVLLSGGYVVQGSSIPQTIYGFARVAGGNGATDGAKSANLYRAEGGRLFSGTLGTTLTDSHRGAKAMLSLSASSWFLNISTAASASYNVVIEGWTSNWALGDTFPEVLFSVLPTKIQGES